MPWFTQGQVCGTNDISFTSQSELYSATSVFSACTEIQGDLNVSGADIYDLQVLSGVSAIYGDLFITGTENLTDLSAFSNLTFVQGEVKIQGNQRLRDLDGLSGLNFSSLVIENNPSLGACAIFNVCDHVSNAGTISISGNMPGCSLEGIQATCNGNPQKYWTDKTGSHEWANPQNWSGGTLPGPTDAVSICGDFEGNLISVSGGDFSLASLNADITSHLVIEAGASLTLMETGSAAAFNSFSQDIHVDGNLIIPNATGTVLQNQGQLFVSETGSILINYSNYSHGIQNQGGGLISNNGLIHITAPTNAGIGILNLDGLISNSGTIRLNDLGYGYFGDGLGSMINTGTLEARNCPDTGFVNHGHLTHHEGALIDVKDAPFVGLKSSGTITGGGDFLTGNAGYLDMNIAGTFNHTGVIMGSGNYGASLVTVGSSIKPGYSPGYMFFEYDQDFTSANFEMELAGVADADFDRVEVQGNANLTNASFSISEIDGFSAAPNNTFVIFSTGGSISGTPSVNLPPNAGGKVWSYTINPDNITVRVDAALPVELLSFTGKAEEKGNVLDWSTATEINSDFFLVESSVNGEDWYDLHRVNAAGNSLVQRNYRFIDENTESDILFYRLRMVDTDGTFDYSEIIRLNRKDFNEVKFSVFPNPSFGNFQVKGSDQENLSFEIYNAKGDVISFRRMGDNVTLDKPVSGIYFIRIYESFEYKDNIPLKIE